MKVAAVLLARLPLLPVLYAALSVALPADTDSGEPWLPSRRASKTHRTGSRPTLV